VQKQAVANAWSAAGAKGVVLIGRNGKKLETTASSLQVPHLVVEANIADEHDVESAFEKTLKEYGQIDVIVNTAGAGNSIGFAAGQTEPSQWWTEYVRHLRPHRPL
jgi:NADP-dependent 3-hydroxy acid dehydrogenase YdfG